MDDSTEPDIDKITISTLPSRIFNHTLSEEELVRNSLKVTVCFLQMYLGNLSLLRHSPTRLLTIPIHIYHYSMNKCINVYTTARYYM